MNIRYYWYQTISCSSFDSLGAVMIAMFSNDCPYYLSVFCKIHLSVFFAFVESYATWIEDLAAVKSGEPNGLHVGQLWIEVDAFCDLFIWGVCVCVCYSIIVSVAAVVVVVTAISLKPAKLGKKKNVLLRMRSGFLHMLYFYPVSLLVRHAKLLSCV